MVHFARRRSAPNDLGFTYFNDHFRHMRFAWESLSLGPKIHAIPLRDFARIGDERAYAWIDSPYLHPAGALGVFMPFAVLSFTGVIPSDIAGDALVYLFTLSGMLAAQRVWRYGVARPVRLDSAVLWSVAAFLCLIHAVNWGLHGQYDGLVVLVLMVGAGAATPSRRMAWLGAAFFLKFQALLLLPLFVRDALHLWAGEKSLVREPAALVGVLLAAASIGTAAFLAWRGFLTPERYNPLVFGGPRVAISTLVLTGALAALAFVRGEWMIAAVIVWCFSAFASLAPLQAWYLLYPYAFLPYLRRRGAALFVCWIVGFTYLIGWLPSFHRAVDELLVLPPFHP